MSTVYFIQAEKCMKNKLVQLSWKRIVRSTWILKLPSDIRLGAILVFLNDTNRNSDVSKGLELNF